MEALFSKRCHLLQEIECEIVKHCEQIKQTSTEMSQKELVKKRTEYDFSVPKMRFA